MAEGTLHAFIVALRSNSSFEDQLVAAEAQRVRDALQNPSKTGRAEAMLKVAYLRMIGLDCNWAAAGAIEVMSYPSAALSRPGFLAAAVTFNPETPVILLAVNLLRKKLLNAADTRGVCLALTTAATIATSEIASALAPDVSSLVQSGKPQVRVRACACLLAFSKVNPAVLLSSYPLFKDLLMDPDVNVKTAACSALLELVSKQPGNYANLAPLIYILLESGKNSNFCCVKSLIILRLLCPYEQRLGPKLVPLLTSMLQQENVSLSLVNEIISIAILCLPANLDLSQKCLQAIKDRFIVPDDHLKTAGLLLLSQGLDQARGWPERIKTLLDSEMMKEIAPLVQSPHALMRAAALKLLRFSVTRKTFPALSKILLDLLDEDSLAPETASDFVDTLLGLAETKDFTFVDDLRTHCVTLLKMSLRPDLQGRGLAAVRKQLLQLADKTGCAKMLLRGLALHLAVPSSVLANFAIKFYLARLPQAISSDVPQTDDAAMLADLTRAVISNERHAEAVAAGLAFPVGGAESAFVRLLASLLEKTLSNAEQPCETRGLAIVLLARLAGSVDNSAGGIGESFERATQTAKQLLTHRYAALRLGARALAVAPGALALGAVAAAPAPQLLSILEEPFDGLVPALLKPKKKRQSGKKRKEPRESSEADGAPAENAGTQTTCDLLTLS